LTSIQRENVWHPYYEIKTEDEDFKEKYLKQQKEKKEKQVGSNAQEMEDLEKKLKSFEEKEAQER
jgi:hypothetical protein